MSENNEPVVANHTQPVIARSKNKTRIVIGAAALLVLALVIIAIRVSSSSPERRIREQMDLGYKYLSELNYEQAVACFEAIIEIDPKNIDAYKGIVDVYRQSGDDEAALAAAQRAYEATGEQAFRDLMDELTPAVPEEAPAPAPEPAAEEPAEPVAEEADFGGLSGDPNEVVVEETYGPASLTIYGDCRVVITLTDNSIQETYTVGKGTVEIDHLEYGWGVYISDGTNTLEASVQSWMWEERPREQVSLVGSMQHSIWYDGCNVKDMDIVLDGHTIIWDFYIPKHGENGYYEDLVIPQFDLMNTHINSVYITLDGEDIFY